MKTVLLYLSAVLLVVGLAACGGDDGGTDDPKVCDPACAEGETCTDGKCVADEPVTCDPACAEGEECVEGQCVVPVACDPACTEDQECVEGACVTPEPPVCDPACTEDEECNKGVCEPKTEDPCQEACEGKDCGTVDECTCGTGCPEGTECNETLYVCECVEACLGEDGTPFECGDNGCGDVCGSCSGKMLCEAHVCVCPADACDGKSCGPDGCGGTCGECGADQACTVLGQCVDGCDYENMEFDETVQKINYMSIGKGGLPGEALDVDGDPDTCAPADNCTDGLNNQLSGLLGQLEQFVDADAEIENALAEGSIILLAEMVEFIADGSEFTMNMYIGVLGAEECDHQTVKCDYLVNPDSYDLESCLPLIAFPETTITDGQLVAGGPDSKFTISVPIQEGLVLAVTANMAQVVATVEGEGDDMILKDGLIGGAVRKDKLMEAIDLLPPDALEGLPVSPEMIKNLLNMFVVPDVDEDGDGELDAASIGVKFGTIAGAITSVDLSE